MSLTTQEFKVLLEKAKEAALEAGKLIAHNHDKKVQVHEKDGGENYASRVVTEIDLKAQEKILEVLNSTLSQFNLGLLAEESLDDQSRFQKDYFWCIDPLDGTLAFSQNKDGYSTSIGLVSRSGQSIIGAVYNPRTHDLYFAQKGSGAYKNDSPLHISPASNSLTLYYDYSYSDHPFYSEHILSIKEKLKELELRDLTECPLGGAVMNALGVIENSPSLYYKLPKKNQGGGSIWDFAASSVIISEAGGFVGNFDRQELNLNQPSTFMNEQGIIYASSANLLDLIPRTNHE